MPWTSLELATIHEDTPSQSSMEFSLYVATSSYIIRKIIWISNLDAKLVDAKLVSNGCTKILNDRHSHISVTRFIKQSSE